MSKAFSPAFGFLMLLALLLCACQPTVAVTATRVPEPSPTIAPTAASVITPEALWTFKTGGAIWGTPTVGNSTVYFGSDDGTVYALDAQKGTPRWKFATQGIVRSKPALAGNSIYFASDDGYLYALDARSGAQVWRTDIGNFVARDVREKLGTSTDPKGYDDFQSSPLVVDGKIYIGSFDGNLYAVAADNGLISWTFKAEEKIRATPALADGVVYVGSWDEAMYAVDAKTGQLRWKTSVEGEVQTTALVANGLVYTASRKASVMALDAQTGDKKWEYAYGRNIWVESSPQLVGNILYIGSSGRLPVYGIDSQTGKPFTFFFASAFYWSTPAIARDILYIGATSFRQDNPNKGGLLALRLVDGKIPDANREYAFFPVPEREKAEGNWSGVASSPVVQNDCVYFGALDGNLYALRAVQ